LLNGGIIILVLVKQFRDGRLWNQRGLAVE
jgi:hypothetical protein